MYLIVLDLSLNSSGIAIFNITNRPKLIHYTIVDNNHFETKEVGKKLTHLEMALQTFRFTYFPHIVVKEELVRTKFIDSEQLSKTHGIAEKTFMNSEMHDMNNKTFKKAFVGNGNATKEDVAVEVIKYEQVILGKNKHLHFKTDDESDSIGIGIQWLIDQGKIKKIEKLNNV